MEASTEKKSTIENSTENSFDEAMSNMVNSENAPPFMKKWLDQQPQFKNKDGKIVDLTSEESMKEFISQCEQAIKDLEEGLEKNVILKGLTNHMEKCYQNHAMYVLTSYREGLPLVLIEAKANALPLVSFDVISGPREIISHGEDGILIPPYDTEKMAEEIYELLEKPEKRLRLSENSQNNLELFSKETILSQWKALIQEFVG